MYSELLKQLYYKERKKLEAMWIYGQESKIRLLKLRKNILERAQSRLSTDEISGRADIAEEVKDKLLNDGINEDKMRKRLEKIKTSELTEIENEEKDEIGKAEYPAEEYADYLLQFEKILALEDAISEERLFPEQVYEEQKYLNEKKDSTKDEGTNDA